MKQTKGYSLNNICCQGDERHRDTELQGLKLKSFVSMLTIKSVVGPSDDGLLKNGYGVINLTPTQILPVLAQFAGLPLPLPLHWNGPTRNCSFCLVF